jgi:hypothetical protein
LSIDPSVYLYTYSKTNSFRWNIGGYSLGEGVGAGTAVRRALGLAQQPLPGGV